MKKTRLPHATGTQALERALALLELIAQQPRTITSLARAQSMARPTVSRLVRALERHSYVMRTDDNQIKIGTRPLMLASGWWHQGGLPYLLQRHAERISKTFNETALACIRDRLESICIARAEPSCVFRLSVPIGHRSPLHAGAVHKVLLAYAPSFIMEEVLAKPLKRFTSTTICSPSALKLELKTIRAQGFARSQGETDQGACSIAFPVFGPGDEILASICIAGPYERMRDVGMGDIERRFIKMVADLASEIDGRAENAF